MTEIDDHDSRDCMPDYEETTLDHEAVAQVEVSAS